MSGAQETAPGIASWLHNEMMLVYPAPTPCAGSFVGAMAMMSDNDGQRLAIVATVPLMPVLTLLAFAWWAGQLKASCMATGVRAFTRMCWTVYRLYATPGIFAAVLLTFMGHFNDPNTAAVYSSFLWACTGGIAMFLGLYWLAEDAQ